MILIEFPTYDLLVYHWLKNTRGTVINIAATYSSR